jgi:hypothetical protein
MAPRRARKLLPKPIAAAWKRVSYWAVADGFQSTKKFSDQTPMRKKMCIG